MKKHFRLIGIVLLGILISSCTPITTTPLSTTPTATVINNADIWRPATSDTWQIQFSGDLDTTIEADIYVVDGFEIMPEEIESLHQDERKVICYLNAGAWEDWRPDASGYPTEVLGEVMEGWPGERWLDIRQLGLLAPLIEARMDMCQSKGCDGIDPDNVHGYTQFTGFELSYNDQIRFNQFLAEAAHERGMSIGLKNDLEQIDDLVGDFDWALNEQCFEYDECDYLTPFIKANKPVFNIEYNLEAGDFCSKAEEAGFYSQIKNLELDAWRMTCR